MYITTDTLKNATLTPTESGYFHKRLYYCKAWMYPIWVQFDDERIRAIALQSYNTTVALFFVNTESLIVLDAYSATTQQHVSKFARLVRPKHTFYLYKRSDHTGYIGINGRLTTKQVEYLLIDD